MTLRTMVGRLLVAWVAIWVLSFLSELTGSGLAGLLALDPRALLSGSPGERLAALPGVLGYALCHAPFSVLHVAINAYLLWVFGPEVEVLYRGPRFLRLLLVVTLVGSALRVLLYLAMPASFSGVVLGGSGIVSAVIAINAAMYPGRVLNLILLQCRMITFFLVLLGLDVLWFIADLAGTHNQVANDVHLAGAAVGWIWAGGLHRFGGPLQRLQQRRQAARQTRERDARASEEKELDRILAKISREGMSALTGSERRFLQRRSRRRE